MKYTVKQARLLAGRTQKHMARSLGVHVQTYRKIEQNPEKATIKQAYIISKETGIPYDNIFFDHNSTFSR